MITQSYYGTYSAFTNYLSTIISSHRNISSWGIGEVDDYSITGEDVYPRGFIELPIQSEISERLITWNCAFTITDQTDLERYQEQSDISKCFDIALDILEAIKDPIAAGYTAATVDFYRTETNFNILTLTRFKDDFTSGVRCEFQVRQANPTNTCTLSNSFTFIPSTVCDYTISNTHGWVNYCNPDASELFTDIWNISGITCPVTLRVHYSHGTLPPNPQKVRIHSVVNGLETQYSINQHFFDVVVNNGDQFQVMIDGQNLVDYVEVTIDSITNITSIQDFTINSKMSLNDPAC